MARPSVAEQRRSEIAAGTVKCLQLHGFAGTTLTRIAEVCDMSRGHVRHYMGNRDALLIAAAKEFFEGDPEVPQDGLENLDEIVDYYFGDTFTDPNEENTAVRAFLDASQQLPAIREVVRRFYVGQRDIIAHAIEAENPTCNKVVVAETAHALMTFALGNAFFSDVDADLARGDMPKAIVEQILSRVR